MIADCCEQGAKRPAYDKCTLLKWFISMDTDASGEISKDEFVAFLRENTQLQTMMLGQLKDTTSDGICATLTPRRARRSREALGVKRMVKLFKQIDENGNGVMDYEEFVEFFRRAGFLLEYSTSDNPRSREEEMLGNEHRRRVSLSGTTTTDPECTKEGKMGQGQDKKETALPVSTQWARRRSETSWASEQLKELIDQRNDLWGIDPRRRKTESSCLGPDLRSSRLFLRQRRWECTMNAVSLVSCLEPWSVSRNVDDNRPPPFSSEERSSTGIERPLRLPEPSLQIPHALASLTPEKCSSKISCNLQCAAEGCADVTPRPSCRSPNRRHPSPRKAQRSCSKSPRKSPRKVGGKSPRSSSRSPRKSPRKACPGAGITTPVGI